MRPSIIGPILGAAVMVSFVIIGWKFLDTFIIALFLCFTLINVVWGLMNRKKHLRRSDSGDMSGGDRFGDSGSGSHGHGHHDGGGFDGGGGH